MTFFFSIKAMIWISLTNNLSQCPFDLKIGNRYGAAVNLFLNLRVKSKVFMTDFASRIRERLRDLDDIGVNLRGHSRSIRIIALNPRRFSSLSLYSSSAFRLTCLVTLSLPPKPLNLTLLSTISTFADIFRNLPNIMPLTDCGENSILEINSSPWLSI